MSVSLLVSRDATSLDIAPSGHRPTYALRAADRYAACRGGMSLEKVRRSIVKQSENISPAAQNGQAQERACSGKVNKHMRLFVTGRKSDSHLAVL